MLSENNTDNFDTHIEVSVDYDNSISLPEPDNISALSINSIVPDNIHDNYSIEPGPIVVSAEPLLNDNSPISASIEKKIKRGRCHICDRYIH